MNQWIDARKCLPLNGSYCIVKILILWKQEKKSLFINGYFVSQGENITRWVTHWRIWK